MRSSDGEKRDSASGTGCAVAFVLVLVAVGLILLGNEGATTEAMPFGLALLAIALLVGLVSGVALARFWSAEVASEEPAQVGGAVVARPPATVQCPSCGGGAPIRLAEPTHSTCGFCRTRFALASDLARAIVHAAHLLDQQACAERQIEASIGELAPHEKAWTTRLKSVTTFLVGLGVALAAVALLIQNVEHDWPYYFGMGVAGAMVAGMLGGFAISVVPRAARTVVGRWTAIRLPGEAGLACRVCGGPLPQIVAPVLRCVHCSADNFASSEVIAKVAVTAHLAQHGVLAVAARRRRSDDMAAFALKFFPIAVALAWIVVAALTGPVVGAILRLGRSFV